jgi:hypothetical protein
MLSDIPSSNVLCLRDGKTNNFMPAEKTFSANIYDLLKNQFFLDAPVGKMAEEVFNIIIGDYNNKKVSLSEYSDNKDFYNWLVGQIGDEYFKKTIKKMINYLERLTVNEED